MATKLFLLLLACSCGITDILAKYNISHLGVTKSCGCGFDKGSEIVQILTRKFKCIEGTFWNKKIEEFLFTDRHAGSISGYKVKEGATSTLYIKELQDQEIVSQYPIHGRKHQFIIVGNNTLYLLKKDHKDDDVTYTIKEVMKVTDGSQIITKTVITHNGNLIITTEPANKKEGEGQLLRVNMTSQKVETLDTGFDFPAGVCFDVYYRHLYVLDVKQGKIWQYKHNVTNGKISDKKVIFDIKYHTYSINGNISAITMDREGILWIGALHSLQVSAYDIHIKQVVRKIPIPTSAVSALTWAGKNLDILFVGSSVIHSKRETAAGRIIAVSGIGSRGFNMPWIHLPNNIQ